MVLTKVIRPAAKRAGIKRRIGWHTFCHTYSTMLIANGENVKVVQELMRHANSRCTLDVYGQARVSAKREAQRRLTRMIRVTNKCLLRSNFSVKILLSAWEENESIF